MPEIGYQSVPLVGWGELATDSAEKNPALVWPLSIDAYDQMRSEDSQVISVLRACMLPIQTVAWRVDRAGARADVTKQIADDLGLPVKGRNAKAPVRSRDRFSWDEHLRLALLELPFGHSYFEQVYRAEGNQLHLHKLAWRPPRTIKRFEVAADGGLQAIVQHGLIGQDIRIPVERLVAYVNEREGGNWAGRSVLRSAYKNWLLKDRVLRAQSLTVERNGLGVPVYTGAAVPEGASAAEREAWLESEQKSGLSVATKFRAGDAAGASITPGAKLELMGVKGTLPDTDKPIRYHDEQIARAVLAHFLNLGTETGSWALGSTFADFFGASLNAVCRHIRSVTQQHVIEDLVDLNWGPNEPAPQLVFEPVGSEHPATSEAIRALVECGAIEPDEPLESHLRTLYGLPAKDANTTRTKAPAVAPPADPAAPTQEQEGADAPTDPAPGD